MSGQRVKVRKVRRKRRSYRNVKHFLWAFSLAGSVLGVALIGWFGLQGNWRMAKVGMVYVSVAAVLFGVRGILEHKDAERRRRSTARSSRSTL
jgi:nicotinamide mononucleotide (NMN) deamidase PncC